MDKWSNLQFKYFLEGERVNCYWFWSKGKITRRKNRDTGVVDESVQVYGEWNGIRLQNGFNHCFNILTDSYMRGLKEGKYNGQTKSEFDKNYKRVKDIFDKSGGDIDKAVSLAKTQANRITDEWKAINRSMCAKQTPYLDNKDYEIYESIFEVFFQRAYELGSVSKLEYREYKLEKLGI
jgi:hypothetical protein